MAKKLILTLLIAFVSFNSALSDDFWTKTGDLPAGAVNTVVVDPTAGTVYAGIEGEGVYKSNDNGDTWIAANTGLTNDLVMEIAIKSDGTLFAATNGSGIFRSIDGGASWVQTNENLGNINLLCVAVDKDGNILTGAWFYGAVYRSTDNGDSWEELGVKNYDVHSVFGASDGTYFAGTQMNGLHRSTDGGSTWDDVGPFSDKNVYDFAEISPGNIIAGTSDGLYFTDNNGDNWTKKASGMANLNIRSVHVADNGFIYTGTLNGGVYRSIDGGNKWALVQNGLPSIISGLDMVVNEEKIMFVATNLGVYRSNKDVEKLNLYVEVEPETQSKDWNDTYEYTVSVTDDSGDPVADAQVSVTNNLDGSTDNLPTDAGGLAVYTGTVPDGKENGSYEIEFNAAKDQYNSSGAVSAWLNVSHVYTLILSVTPETVDTADWEDEITLQINVKNDAGAPVDSATVNIFNTLTELPDEFVITDPDGNAEYSFIVPEVSDDSYEVNFFAKKEGSYDSDFVIRMITVDHYPGSVFDPELKKIISLYNNAPEPFAAQTKISFELSEPAYASFEYYSAAGEKVAATSSGMLGAGRHTETFEAAGLPSGTYYCLIKLNGRPVHLQKMTRTGL